tara:strand:+ start:24385 stop:24783 length:399 start_codon:yes stop_codon:yes gene_type:complete
MAKKKTLKYWKTKIDKPFHEYIRRSNVNSEGYGQCITCDKGIHFSESDAGHFISRGALSTRWCEDNVRLQCRKCNRFEYGRQFEFSLKLGSELAESLLIKSKQVFKLMEHEYQEIFETYRDKLAELKKNQNF